MRTEQTITKAEPAITADGVLRMLDDVVAERRVKPRDCRECKNFQRDASGLNFGWCRAHKQFVKLYHPAGKWFSQCTFKGLRRFKDQELERAGVVAGAQGDELVGDPSKPVAAGATMRARDSREPAA